MKGLVLMFAMLLPQFGSELNHVRDYSVKIHIVLPDGTEGGGSGVYVDDNIILTANHLWASGAKFYLDDDHKVQLTVGKWSEEHDLLTLVAFGKHKHVKLGNLPQVMEDLVTVGHPMGDTQVMVRGYLVAKTKQRLLIDGTTIRGMSGGGVFNQYGRLVGICVQSWGDQDQQFMVAVSVDIIREFLK